MCLDRLAKFKVHKYQGWQWVVETTIGLQSAYMECPVESNEWQKDPLKLNIRNINLGLSYPTGFHIILRKKDAKLIKPNYIHINLVLKKVYFRNVVAKGYQYGAKVAVARERFVVD